MNERLINCRTLLTTAVNTRIATIVKFCAKDRAGFELRNILLYNTILFSTLLSRLIIKDFILLTISKYKMLCSILQQLSEELTKFSSY